MGLGGISIWQLLIVLAIVILLFGTKKLRSIGGDMGSAIKSFRQSVRDGEQTAEDHDTSIHHDAKQNQSQSSEKDKNTS